MIRSVLFDAAGTLFQTAEPVGETYARFARDAGITADAAALDRGFRVAFAAAPPLAFPGADPSERPALERRWWRQVVVAAFAGAQVEGPHRSIDRAFEAVFEHFAAPSAWRVFSDVLPALSSLRDGGLRLAVVSNFDGRLGPLLRGLDLARFFHCVVSSGDCGFAKPDPRIFTAALRAIGGDPPSALHIGDSLTLDVLPARAAGLAALRVDRLGPRDDDTIADLGDLGTRLGR